MHGEASRRRTVPYVDEALGPRPSFVKTTEDPPEALAKGDKPKMVKMITPEAIEQSMYSTEK